MLDSKVRELIDKPLDIIGRKLDFIGLTPNSITAFGFFCGILSILFIANNDLNYGLLFLCLNRLSDGLDGAVARASKLSDFGGFLDIVADFIIYSGVVFAFAIKDQSEALYAAFLIFSFIGPITSFLAYAIIAAKKDINTSKRGVKSFYYLGGICEGTETAFVLMLICVLPNIFAEVCIVYGILCWVTTAGRVYATWSDFGEVD
jgi:phosphatidylglycerophosphate synthase